MSERKPMKEQSLEDVAYLSRRAQEELASLRKMVDDLESTVNKQAFTISRLNAEVMNLAHQLDIARSST